MLLSPSSHRFVYILALIIVACSLPFSVFATSVGIITLLVNFLLEGNWRVKSINLQRNRVILFSLLLYLPVLYSFFYSSNTTIAIRELRLWLPFLLVPPVVAMSNPLSKREFRWITLMFVLAVLVATLISTAYLLMLSGNSAIDTRQISLFISHIRFALMINLAVAILVHFIVFESFLSKWIAVTMILIAFWLVVFLFILQSLTGIVMVGLLIFVGFVWIYVMSKSSVARFAIATVGLSVFFIIISIVTHTVDEFYTRNRVDFKTLKEFTVNGNPYQNDTARLVYENGNLVYINICYPELRREWERRSSLSFDGLDKKGQRLDQTLIRYMTSIGLTKDSAGVWKLDPGDIQLVEDGATSVVFKEGGIGLSKRIYQLLWEFDAYRSQGTIANSPMIQRLVFAKAAWFVIENHFWWGVGWGDLQENLNTYYKTNHINLSEEYHFMPHNQYLTVWARAGFVGFVFFLMALMLPFILMKKNKHFLPLYFLAMVAVSMLNEDTFETHIGITLAVLFGSLFIFGYSFTSKTDEPESPKI